MSGKNGPHRTISRGQTPFSAQVPFSGLFAGLVLGLFFSFFSAVLSIFRASRPHRRYFLAFFGLLWASLGWPETLLFFFFSIFFKIFLPFFFNFFTFILFSFSFIFFHFLSFSFIFFHFLSFSFNFFHFLFIFSFCLSGAQNLIFFGPQFRYDFS